MLLGAGHTPATTVSLHRDGLFSFFKDFFEAWIAAQRVPPRKEFQSTIAERAWEADDAVQFFKSEDFVVDAGSDHCQICHRPDPL